jgi:hypothetical protein
MKHRVAACCLLVALGTGCGSAGGGAEPPAETTPAPALADGRYFGYIGGLARADNPPVIEFDPAEFLTGDEAYEAALADGAIVPGEPVSNDYYIRNDDRSVVRLAVGPEARVTVASCPASCTEGSRGDLADFLASLSDPSEKTLADEYRGTNSQYWIVVESGLVERIDEQYVP